MRYTVLLQRHPENDGYTATALVMPNCIGVGENEKEALENVQTLICETLSRSKLVTIDVDTDVFKIERKPNRWFGAFKEDATWGKLFDEIECLRDMTIEEE
jgi:hypothetical protein